MREHAKTNVLCIDFSMFLLKFFLLRNYFKLNRSRKTFLSHGSFFVPPEKLFFHFHSPFRFVSFTRIKITVNISLQFPVGQTWVKWFCWMIWDLFFMYCFSIFVLEPSSCDLLINHYLRDICLGVSNITIFCCKNICRQHTG